jgi:hypothetical protein
MLRITLDTKQLISELVDFRRDQLPFWVSLTLNGVASEVQGAQKQVLMQRGGYRSAGGLKWALNQVRFDSQSRARKDKLRAEVFVFTGVGTYSLLPLRERGGIRGASSRTPGVGIYGPRVAVPLEDNMPRKLYPVNLGLQPRRAIEGGFSLGKRRLGEQDLSTWSRTRTLRGKERTWVMRTARGPIVFQRIGRGNTPGARRPLFALKTSVPVPAIGGGGWFYSTAQRVVQQRSGAIAYGAWQRAIRSARPA